MNEANFGWSPGPEAIVASAVNWLRLGRRDGWSDDYRAGCNRCRLPICQNDSPAASTRLQRHSANFSSTFGPGPGISTRGRYSFDDRGPDLGSDRQAQGNRCHTDRIELLSDAGDGAGTREAGSRSKIGGLYLLSGRPRRRHCCWNTHALTSRWWKLPVSFA